MNKQDFFSSVTAVLLLESDETIPTDLSLSNTIHFSFGINLPSIAVTVSEEALSEFQAADPSERKEIIDEIFTLYQA